MPVVVLTQKRMTRNIYKKATFVPHPSLLTPFLTARALSKTFWEMNDLFIPFAQKEKQWRESTKF